MSPTNLSEHRASRKAEGERSVNLPILRVEIAPKPVLQPPHHQKVPRQLEQSRYPRIFLNLDILSKVIYSAMPAQYESNASESDLVLPAFLPCIHFPTNSQLTLRAKNTMVLTVPGIHLLQTPRYAVITTQPQPTPPECHSPYNTSKQDSNHD